MNRYLLKNNFCQINKKKYPIDDLVKGISLRTQLLKFIKLDHPDFKTDGYISLDELNKYRERYISNLLENEKGELNNLEKEVLKKINSSQIISKNVEKVLNKNITFGQHLADLIAQFGGSWAFILLFFSFIILWIFSNIFILFNRGFDPYPFILLNLILSCLAAIQAPIIMMSQNRQESKDRLRSEHDYQINLKSELEIRQLHEKLDHLIIVQMQRLLEIQQLQIDLMEEILSTIKKDNHKNI